MYTKTDFIIPDTMPIDLTRTYRHARFSCRDLSESVRVIHTRCSSVGTTWPYTFVDLILPDGGRVHYDRVSPGTSFTDAIYEHNGSPSAFYKSRIRWIGGWELKLRDGSVYMFPDGGTRLFRARPHSSVCAIDTETR